MLKPDDPKQRSLLRDRCATTVTAAGRGVNTGATTGTATGTATSQVRLVRIAYLMPVDDGQHIVVFLADRDLILPVHVPGASLEEGESSSSSSSSITVGAIDIGAKHDTNYTHDGPLLGGLPDNLQVLRSFLTHKCTCSASS